MAFNYFLCEALKYVSQRLEDSFTNFGGMAPLSNGLLCRIGALLYLLYLLSSRVIFVERGAMTVGILGCRVGPLSPLSPMSSQSYGIRDTRV
jgi:hypothetical protein